jgi:membrane protein
MSPAAPRNQSPWSLPFAIWRTVIWQTWLKIGHDNIMLIAAGVAFYGFLAFVPLLAAVGLIYGLFADVNGMTDTARSLLQIMPPDAASLILGQLSDVVKASSDQKGWGLIFALGFALFGASRAASAVIMALNMAHDREETRSFIRLNLLTLMFTLGFVIIVVATFIAMSGFALMETRLAGLPPSAFIAISIVATVVMILFAAAVVATAYRYGPDRDRPEWHWISPGSLLATIGGLSVSFLFGIYVSNFASYNATYGALGAVVVLLIWLWLTALVLCAGAELNATLERLPLPEDHERAVTLPA